MDEIALLLSKNNERTICKSIKATALGNATVMSYEDIIEAQKSVRRDGGVEAAGVDGDQSTTNQHRCKFLRKDYVLKKWKRRSVR